MVKIEQQLFMDLNAYHKMVDHVPGKFKKADFHILCFGHAVNNSVLNFCCHS